MSKMSKIQVVLLVCGLTMFLTAGVSFAQLSSVAHPDIVCQHPCNCPTCSACTECAACTVGPPGGIYGECTMTFSPQAPSESSSLRAAEHAAH